MSLVQDPDNGLLYGTTEYGGINHTGVLFSYDISASTYTKLLDFTGPNGAYPCGSLTLVKDTSIYTGLKKISGAVSGVKVYPNPSNTYINIAINNFQNKIEYIYLYNQLGALVLSQNLTNSITTIPVSSLAVGIYHYRIMDNKQSSVKEGNVVIIR